MVKLEWGEGRRRFLALKGEIEAALREGISGRKVWQRYEDRLGFGYRGFSKLVSRYIGDVLPVPSQSVPARRSRGSEQSPSLATPPEQEHVRNDSPTPPRDQKRFVHNNTPSKEYVRNRLGLPDTDE